MPKEFVNCMDTPESVIAGVKSFVDYAFNEVPEINDRKEYIKLLMMSAMQKSKGCTNPNMVMEEIERRLAKYNSKEE